LAKPDLQPAALVIEVIRALARRGGLPRELAQAPLDGRIEIDQLGIDSLGKLNLLSELEERADVTLSEWHLCGLRTIDELGRLLQELRRR
jgi:acyl carrier protein